MSTPEERTAVIESDIANRVITIEHDLGNRTIVIESEGDSSGGLYPSKTLFPSLSLFPSRAYPVTGRTGMIETEDRTTTILCQSQDL